MLDTDKLKDAETGVEHYLATMWPYFAKDNQAVFVYRLFQMLRRNRGQIDFQRQTVCYETARHSAAETWVDITTPRPAADAACSCFADVTAEVRRLIGAEKDGSRADTAERKQTWTGPLA